ncbi:MAG TPA: sarcosine oxidase subunit gamma family protein [Beijerinckiaceae bacterium]|nr:sarcosine oxidase subunit gamma family protein [Beijerinckiaceae bacterium]
MSDRMLASRRGVLDGLFLPKGEEFSLTPAPDAARFTLRGSPQAARAFGPAPPQVLRATSKGERLALWLGPDEILLIAPGEDAGAVQTELEHKLAGEPHALVDVSHRQIGLVLEGRLAARCLSAGCPLDLRLSAFPVGMATRTIFLKAEIVLFRQEDQRFHVEVWRSFAPYLIGHLGEALIGATGL